MFAKIRRKTALYQLGVVAAVLLVVFAFSCVYNYERMLSEVDKRLTSLEKVGTFFPDRPKTELGFDGQRNALVIRVYSDGKYKLSTNSFYDEESVKKLISVATDDNDKITVNGNNIAYSMKKNGGNTFYTIYVYDYTGEFQSFLVNLLTTLLTGLAVMLVVAFFVFRFTNRNLAPIEDAFNKQKELIANASHELKTPLTIINTDLAILNSTADEMTEDQRKWLAGIGTQVARMSAMINEMLELARLESGRGKDFEKVDLSFVTQTVVLETEALAFEKHIVMSSEIADSAYVTARKQDIEKLVFILIENALKYTEPDGKITVSLVLEKHKAVLKVRNTGEGIPRERMPKLFDRFYRCDESHTESGSFGLGLSIAKAIADANNATIGVDSEEGCYTEFIVVFKESGT